MDYVFCGMDWACLKAWFWSPETAAWVQAIASVGAILVAICVARHQSQASREMVEAQMKRQEAERNFAVASDYMNALRPLAFLTKELEGALSSGFKCFSRNDVTSNERVDGWPSEKAKLLADCLEKFDIQAIPLVAGEFVQFLEHARYAYRVASRCVEKTDHDFIVHSNELLHDLHHCLESMHECSVHIDNELKKQERRVFVTAQFLHAYVHF